MVMSHVQQSYGVYICITKKNFLYSKVWKNVLQFHRSDLNQKVDCSFESQLQQGILWSTIYKFKTLKGNSRGKVAECLPNDGAGYNKKVIEEMLTKISVFLWHSAILCFGF